MSISVDDLVSSLSTSHIGQEAIDLATLQSQLAQALIELSSTSTSTETAGSYAQPCNTPTGRTPSNSFSWGQMMDVQRTVMSRRSHGSVDETCRDSDDMEDERMVEDILIPASPPSVPNSASLFGSSQQQQVSPTWSHPRGFAPASPGFPTDLFTTADPFYNAQLQAMQNHANSTSALAQLGRPSQHSPFMGQQAPNYSAPGLGMDNHSLLVATSAAFER